MIYIKIMLRWKVKKVIKVIKVKRIKRQKVIKLKSKINSKILIKKYHKIR